MDLLSRLLAYYQISKEDYLELTKDYTLTNFDDGHSFINMDEAISIINKSINNNEKIIVYGDYDADGIMGTSILVKAFQMLKKDVSYYIPSRYLDGYGLTIEHAKAYVKEGYKLVITVDNGISANEAIDYLKDNNINVLVIDHHTIGDNLPNADVIIHPIYSKYGEVGTSGAYCAYHVAKALLNKDDKYLSILAAISLISDMMPLRSYNRNFLKAVFSSYEDNEFYPITLLSEHNKLDESIIGMKVSPRINSLGRLVEDNSINDIVKFFVSNEKDFILYYFNYLDNLNNERKELSKYAANTLQVNTNEKGIIEIVDYKEGMIGLIANSLLNKYHVPVIVFIEDKAEKTLKGSARSIPGFNVMQIFEATSDLCLTSGGHSLAGGCTIKTSDFEEFKKRYLLLVNNADYQEVIHNEIPLYLSEINKNSYDLIMSFSPFGEEWKQPSFILSHIKKDTLTYSKDKNHILTMLSMNAKLVGFNFPQKDLENFEFVDLIGNINYNVYKGYKTIEFRIKEIKQNK